MRGPHLTQSLLRVLITDNQYVTIGGEALKDTVPDELISIYDC